MTIKIIGLSVLTISLFVIGYIIGRIEGRKKGRLLTNRQSIT